MRSLAFYLVGGVLAHEARAHAQVANPIELAKVAMCLFDTIVVWSPLFFLSCAIHSSETTKQSPVFSCELKVLREKGSRFKEER